MEFKIKIVIKIGDTKKIFIPARNVHVSAIPVCRFPLKKSSNLEPKNYEPPKHFPSGFHQNYCAGIAADCHGLPQLG
jgi:hypothetical protein